MLIPVFIKFVIIEILYTIFPRHPIVDRHVIMHSLHTDSVNDSDVRKATETPQTYLYTFIFDSLPLNPLQSWNESVYINHCAKRLTHYSLPLL